MSVHENYDRLLVAADAVAREARYTRYLNDEAILRTHSSAIVPPVLDRLNADPLDDVILSCPGLCYRREGIDRYRVGEPHQMDLWRIRTVGVSLGRDDLLEMIGSIAGAAAPDGCGKRLRHSMLHEGLSYQCGSSHVIQPWGTFWDRQDAIRQVKPRRRGRFFPSGFPMLCDSR